MYTHDGERCIQPDRRPSTVVVGRIHACIDNKTHVRHSRVSKKRPELRARSCVKVLKHCARRAIAHVELVCAAADAHLHGEEPIENFLVRVVHPDCAHSCPKSVAGNRQRALGAARCRAGPIDGRRRGSRRRLLIFGVFFTCNLDDLIAESEDRSVVSVPHAREGHGGGRRRGIRRCRNVNNVSRKPLHIISLGICNSSSSVNDTYGRSSCVTLAIAEMAILFPGFDRWETSSPPARVPMSFPIFLISG
mmetsp:Transcript_4676/g.9145  ORF Transcript_4676/g.9145 Transcript_4676/m.9145 type:complete len:249 (+) Transcript_4676:1167-1913(+)